DLTEAGVSVVSGLATGIDAAAHRGALAAHRLHAASAPPPGESPPGGEPRPHLLRAGGLDALRALPSGATGTGRPHPAGPAAAPRPPAGGPFGVATATGPGDAGPDAAGGLPSAAAPAPPDRLGAGVAGPPPGGAPTDGGAGGEGPAPPIGVAATGLDVVYPRGQAELWRAVTRAGVLLSETPLGCGPERWRFPARNRIIAALADVVVVVESHRRGGSLYTV